MKVDRPRWDDIQAFLAVARSGRLTEAARTLGIEHTTLSRRIDRLESSLGLKLFDRRPTGYTLRREGATLLPYAEELESRAIAIWSDQSDAASTLTGVIRIGSLEGFGTYFLAEIIHDICKTNPGLTVELVALPRNFSLSRRDADLAIALSRPASGRLHTKKLTDYEIGLFGSIAYLEANGTPEKSSELKDHMFVGYIDEFIFAPELDFYAEVLSGTVPTLRMSNIVMQIAAVASGAGLCILPCFMADSNPRLRRVMRDEIKLVRAFWLLTHSDMHNDRRIRLISDFISANVDARRTAFLPG